MKKTTFSADEIPIYEEAVVLKRGDYWQMKMWLPQEKKYARFSLKTRNKDTAIDKAKQHYHDIKAQELAGKTYFSKTTKQGVEAYLTQRAKDVVTSRTKKYYDCLLMADYCRRFEITIFFARNIK